ncbi:MAG: SipW-dependent-type signal peptide-containing protein [Clostridia bacterium]|nr:SipW-dependent-type signal peptide-containing protein [Clostridia bacterium]
MKRKITALCLVIALLAVAVVGGTMAYFTDTETVTNVFTFGNVEIDLFEHKWDPTTNLLTNEKVETNDYFGIVPGAIYPKNPTVENTGDTNAYLRVNVTVNNYSVLKAAIGVGANLGQIFAGHDETVWALANVSEDATADTVTYIYNYIANNGLFAPGATAVVFDSFTVPTGLTSAHADKMNGTFKITVNAEAIQAEGFNNANDAFAAYSAQHTKDLGNIGAAEDIMNAFANLGNGDDASLTLAGSVTLPAGEGIEIPAGVDMDINFNGQTLTSDKALVNEGDAEISDGTLDVNTTGYGAQTAIGGTTVYNEMHILTDGGGVNVWGTAVWNDGSVTTNSVNTNPRHVFYVAGAEGAGHLTINGGEFKFSPTNLTRKGSYICAQGTNATVIVNGGTFHKPSTRTAPIQALDGATVLIYGGTFQFDPSAFVAEGYQAVESAGWWTVTAK